MRLIETLQGKASDKVPFWFMRQAGRYLPEYRAIRKNFKNFLEFCYMPEAATEVTLQPISRFDMDAAIIFSDILVIPDALGQKVDFIEGTGPTLAPLTSLDDLSMAGVEDFLAPVYAAIRLTRAKLDPSKALIGFCGSAWTLACYMLQGKSSKDFQVARKIALTQPAFFSSLLQLLEQAIIQHALAQIAAGANVIQLFDSWAGVLSEREFKAYASEPTARIAAAIRAKSPTTKLIGFPRLSGAKSHDYAHATKLDGVSIDGSISLDFAKHHLQPHIVVQGNLDPQLLAFDKAAALEETRHLLQKLGGKNFIFNLGHGVIPETPVEHVAAISDLIRRGL